MEKLSHVEIIVYICFDLSLIDQIDVGGWKCNIDGIWPKIKNYVHCPRDQNAFPRHIIWLCHFHESAFCIETSFRMYFDKQLCADVRIIILHGKRHRWISYKSRPNTTKKKKHSPLAIHSLNFWYRQSSISSPIPLDSFSPKRKQYRQ